MEALAFVEMADGTSISSSAPTLWIQSRKTWREIIEIQKGDILTEEGTVYTDSKSQIEGKAVLHSPKRFCVIPSVATECGTIDTKCT